VMIRRRVMCVSQLGVYLEVGQTEYLEWFVGAPHSGLPGPRECTH
jgi:hypothetical protein